MRPRIFKKTIAVLFTLVSVMVFASCFGKSKSVSVHNNPVKALQNVEFKLIDTVAISSTEVASYEWKTAQGEGLIRRLSPVSPDHSAKLIQQKKFQIESIYREQKSPYPGMLSSSVVCPKELQPVFKSESSPQMELLQIQAGANSRRSLGVCDPKELAYEAVILEIYCKELNVFFEVEAFRARNTGPSSAKWETWLSQISCNP